MATRPMTDIDALHTTIYPEYPGEHLADASCHSHLPGMLLAQESYLKAL